MTDFFDRYFAYVDNTEPPKIFHLWSLLAGIAAMAGRNIKFVNGPLVTHANLYVMLIGHPGTRKSTSIKMVKRVMKAAGYKTFAADRSTKQKFLLDLEAGFDFDAGADGLGKDVKKADFTEADISELLKGELAKLDTATPNLPSRLGPHEVFVAADEFNDFFGLGNVEFASLLGVLWDIDDIYSDRLKNSKSVHISEPTVSILGGNTFEGFKLAFPPELLGQGFMSRLVLVHGEPSGKKITFLDKEDEIEKATLADFMRAIRGHSVGAVKLETLAADTLHSIYQSWKDLDDSRFRYYSTRRFQQLIKICLVLTMSKLGISLDKETVILANTLLTYTELSMPKALGEYGKSKTSEAAHKIMDILDHAISPVSFKDIWSQLINDMEKQPDLVNLLAGLAEAGRIQRVGQGFLPKRKSMLHNLNLSYVDFKLMDKFGLAAPF